MGIAPAPGALQLSRGFKRPKTAERKWEGDRFSQFGKKQVPAAVSEASEIPHLLPPPAFPILAPQKPTQKLLMPCTRMPFLNGPPSNEGGCDGDVSTAKVLQPCLCRYNPSAKHFLQWGGHTVYFFIQKLL